MKIGLVGCTRTKLDRPAPAKDLYMPSTLFAGRRRYAHDSCDSWLILSAKHHVVDPDEILDPYDVTLVGSPVGAKRKWTTVVLQELEERLGNLGDHHFEIHAGQDYWGFGLISGLESGGATVTLPTQGMRIGAQLAFYADARRG